MTRFFTFVAAAAAWCRRNHAYFAWASAFLAWAVMAWNAIHAHQPIPLPPPIPQ